MTITLPTSLGPVLATATYEYGSWTVEGLGALDDICAGRDDSADVSSLLRVELENQGYEVSAVAADGSLVVAYGPAITDSAGGSIPAPPADPRHAAKSTRPADLDRLVDHVASTLEKQAERELFTAGVRWALLHGWEPTHNKRELGLPTAPPRYYYQRYAVRIAWDECGTSDDMVLWISQARQFGDLSTEVHVTSVQQAVDVLAALTGQGYHLTTGGRTAARLADALVRAGAR